MRLRDIPNFSHPSAGLTIDRPFIEGLAKRIIEDLELVSYGLGRSSGRKVLDPDLALSTIRLLDPKFVDSGGLARAPETGIVSAEIVREYAKAPWDHKPDSFVLMAQYVNGRCFEILQGGAASAEIEGFAQIQLRHLMPKCEDLPYPLNLYAC
ncbi:MAG TPA: hypothetical protein VJN90_11480 [Candidatus Acidoferrales bacterium]|nr:hypothetical protein [Candidatus Acidoferrales bacterium]